MQMQSTCEHCGKPFVRRSDKGKLRHCSKACRLAARVQLIDAACKRCGAPMRVYPSELARGRRQFCSRVCLGFAATKESFEAHLDKTGECWVWTGNRDRDGYGRIHFNGRRELTHRVAWILEHGPIPDGLLIRHAVCDNPPCCRLAHLAPGTQSDNMQDASAKGRLWMQRRQR